MKYLIILLLIFGCSKHKIKIEGVEDIKIETPETISIEPNFESAAEFCDDRYGYMTEEAELCFEDFRDYYDFNIGLDLENLVEFCETYDSEDVDNCLDDLIKLMKFKDRSKK